MNARFTPLILSLFLVTLCTGCLTLENPLVPGSIPIRQGDAPDGLAFAKMIRSTDEGARELHILRELRRGNMPDFLRQLARIRYKARTRSGRTVTVTLWAMKDYLAVGSDEDFVRVPMSPVTGQRVADAFGFSLPTARLVDEIYRASEIKLPPNPFKASDAMVTVEEFLRHDRVIRLQLDGETPEELLAGHKKDVVLSNQLNDRPQKVAIYGWHQVGGLPIQPLSTVHGNWYADYSHGIRLISGMILVDDRPLPLAEVLQDTELAPLVSYEGALGYVRYRTEGAITRKNWWPRS
ncbi:MAG TPA: hypothetical protein VE954_34085 [Oligoflexus sp.]|uniref:hypothetical protein n=1 Tax=Oligoflexus sp. TaxID=1971216 RepID=UPI002D659EF8|nr:hypothetical protein [Oligoflexus sp.]HYX38158.1 hypothetical protein [Oligoflexus sp.]